MRIKQKTKWSLLLLVFLFVVAVLFLFKTRFIHGILDLPKKNTSQENVASTQGSFINLIPVKFTVKSYQEIPLSEGDAFDPRVSPDGSLIVFLCRTNDKNKIAIAELPNRKTFTLDLGLDDYMNPSWNVDGTKIVFAGIKGGVSEIYMYDLKNKMQRQITNAPTRKKYWPRFSPYTFDHNYRIAYVSEVKGRKDIWWVRESGEYDQPITLPEEYAEEYKESSYWKNMENMEGYPAFIMKGGDVPEWSPSGNILIYKTSNNRYGTLAYSYFEWWNEVSIPTPSTMGILTWSPNQTSFLDYDLTEHSAYVIQRDSLAKKAVEQNKVLTSAPSFFPDGKGLALTYKKNDKGILAIAPYDDQLGDVANLWMYPYSSKQKDKMAKNQLLFLNAEYDQIYELYESESYRSEHSEHAKPYLVTSDAVLETFYATFASFFDTIERVEFTAALQEFASKGLEVAREKKVSQDVKNFFLVGLVLLKPDAVKNISPAIRNEVERIQAASGSGKSLFGKKIFYSSFFIRGKYEQQNDLQGYFRALKWFQSFKFNLNDENDRQLVSEILTVTSSPQVYPSIQRINLFVREIIGESRNYGPLTLKELQKGKPLPAIQPRLPWIEQLQNNFTLLPSIYTLDAFIFDELITHTDRSKTVGSRENPRLLPVGMDIMAALGSDEAKKILLEELKEGRFVNYEKRLNEVTKKIRKFSEDIWDQNIYQEWLKILGTLVGDAPGKGPEFIKTTAWKRKQLNTALGSWVNLRYETIGWVEQVAAEAAEAGFEQLNIGRPRGYVEPNPQFFNALNEGFGKISAKFKEIIKNTELKNAVVDRVEQYRTHLKALEVIAQKELDNEMLTDQEYEEILYIGRTIEHFILLMNSLGSQQDEEAGGLKRPDSIRKIVDVQRNPFNDTKLYEALGFVNEINVIVPYYGRREIVKGPVYSYYEFASAAQLNSETWRKMARPRMPVWIEVYYEGTANSVSQTPDLSPKK
jgi:hypothetical protein